jgi:hypothetical protein
MGYARKLKTIADGKGIKISELARACNIPPTTLYSAIHKDTDIRLEYAMLLADALCVPLGELYSNPPAEIVQSDKRFKTKEIDSSELTEFNKLVKEFYVLDNEARQEVFEFIKMKHRFHDDAERLSDGISARIKVYDILAMNDK